MYESFVFVFLLFYLPERAFNLGLETNHLFRATLLLIWMTTSSVLTGMLPPLLLPLLGLGLDELIG